MSIVANLLIVGRKVETYELYTATTPTYWTSTTNYKVTCPAGSRYYILMINTYRSQASTMVISKRDASNNYLIYVNNSSSATGWLVLPNNVAADDHLNWGYALLVLDAGEYLDIAFGTAQDTSAHCNVTFIEISV